MGRNQEISRLAEEIKKYFPNTRPIDESFLRKLFEEKKYARLISEIKNHMGVRFKVSVKCFEKGKLTDQKGAAYIALPIPFPPRNSPAYNELVLDLFMNNDLLNSFYHFVMVTSHEFSHVVLHSLNHPYKNSEEATDIAAIVLGFSKFYELGHTTITSNFFYSSCQKIGYLSFEEVIRVIEIAER